MGRYRRKDLSWKANQSTGIEHEIGRRKGPRAGANPGGSSMRPPSAWTLKAPCLVFRDKILRFPTRPLRIHHAVPQALGGWAGGDALSAPPRQASITRVWYPPTRVGAAK